MRALWPIRQVIIPVFVATRNISTPPWMGLIHRRVTPSIKFAGTHLYTWVMRGTVRVKCLAQEHNAVPWPRLEPTPPDPECSVLPGVLTGLSVILIFLNFLSDGICSRCSVCFQISVLSHCWSYRWPSEAEYSVYQNCETRFLHNR